MDWKDTVMTQDQFEEWCGSYQMKGCGKTRTMCEDYCRPLAQAEISYKAGYKQCEQDNPIITQLKEWGERVDDIIR